MKKSTKRDMHAFDKDIGNYSPDSEIWNALSFLDENSDLGPEVSSYYLNGIYRGILVGRNGKKWGKKAKRALWVEITKYEALYGTY